VGFIITVLILGIAVDLRGPAVVLPVLFGIYLSIWFSSLLIRDPDPQPHPEEQPPISTILRKPPVIAFFLVCFLLQAGHGTYYAFFSIFMEEVGYSKTLIGQLWAIGVVAEVVVFLFMHRLLQRFGARKVLIASLLLAALRWLLIGLFPQQLGLLLIAQILHAATFGTFHASAIHLVHHYFTGRHQGRGQALYSSLSFGAGGAIGSLYSGFLWNSAGPAVAFGVAAAVTVVAVFIAWYWVLDELDRRH